MIGFAARLFEIGHRCPQAAKQGIAKQSFAALRLLAQAVLCTAPWTFVVKI